jgi:hypothetical protein
MTSRGFAQLMGVVFLAFGLLGFIPGMKSPPPAESVSGLALNAGYGHLFGLFPINWVHNIVHVVVGIAGLSSTASHSSARKFARGLAWCYGILAVMGLFPLLNMTFGLIPIYGHDVWLHAGIAAWAAYFGFGQGAEAVESAEYRRAA